MLKFDFTAEDRERMHKLAVKNQAGKLTATEQDELNGYRRIGRLLDLIVAKARLSLKKAVATTDGMESELTLLVWTRAGVRCEYCQLHQDDSRLTFEIDYIIAIKRRGPTVAGTSLSVASIATHSRVQISRDGTQRARS